MNRFAASILALSLATAITAGTASAQSSSNAPAYNNDRSIASDAPYYDYARVIRVDPVLQSGYRTTPSSSQRCWTEDGYYSSDDRYDDRYADRRDDRHYDDRYGDRYSRDRYDDRYGRDRYNDGRYGTETGRNVAAVVGGIVGAALGSKVGGGSARYATAAVGSMVGGMAGREIYETSQRNKQQRTAKVTVCDPVRGDDYRNDRVENTVSAYDVTYEYAGRQHVARTSYHPGDRIRIRVDVQAE
jgi:outer membrane lipoprotein SlyB